MRMYIPALSIKTMLRINKIETDSVRHTVSHGLDRYEIVACAKTDDIPELKKNIPALVEKYVTDTGNATPLVIVRFLVDPTPKPVV